MGMVPYHPMLALQHERHRLVRDGLIEDTLFLLQHPPVITLGRNARGEHVRADAPVLRGRGIEVVSTRRGGDVTYHAPGQIVGYPIVRLRVREQDVRRFVFHLEELLIRTVSDFGISARRIESLRGIWVGDAKLAAIGVRLARWTTMHGFALNVDLDLSGFDLIVPCGIRDRGTTSLAALLGVAPPRAEVEDRLAFHAGDVLQRDVYEGAASAWTMAT